MPETTEQPRNPRRAAKYGTAEEFLAAYEPSDAADADLGRELLWAAARNKDDAARTAIVSRLLADGVDPNRDVRGTNALHVLLGGNSHNPDAEAPLLALMLDHGADVNAVDAREGTPLETIAARFKFTDEDLKPYYDVLFQRADLELLKPSRNGDSVLANLRKWEDRRPDLVSRAEAYLTDHGIPVPPA